MQFKAGYIVDAIAKVITDFKVSLNKQTPADHKKLDQINGLLQYASSFDVEFPEGYNLDCTKLNSVLATLNNIITRGLPTRAPIILENIFSEIGLTERNTDEFELNFPIAKKSVSPENIFELLHIIEPNLRINRTNYGGDLGSEGEWKFLDKDLTEHPYAKQILQSQREFATINRNLNGGRSLDFSFEFPYLNTTNVGAKKKGVIFEYDGYHHKATSYKYYDNYRDDAADEEGFDTLRQPSERLELEVAIVSQFKNEIFQIFKKNYERDTSKFLEEYSLIFIPIAVARIHKTLIEFLLSNPNELEKGFLEIAIIERDLPCGAIAVKSLQELFENINAILEDDDKLLLPKINLTIFENKDWVIDQALHLNASKENEEHFKLKNFDIIIDHSILRRSNIYNEVDFQNDKAIKIRSSHYFDNAVGKARRIYCADLLKYKPLVEKKDDGSYVPVAEYEANINYFIQTIFRKVSFRDGQLPIISRALQQKPVIGLLPTGGGKSLTFQLPTFLQPGLCLVVDPIKSLMEDQVRVLQLNWIDCCDYINSNLEKEEKQKKLIDFRLGETMFLFISPERFVMEDFRNIISKIDVSKFCLGFSYCVIDEVHCVSEWGHDFRSTYLMLGKNAQRFATTRSKKPVSLIGLTATASFDVLADIEREIQIKHDDVADAIIMIENTIRPELFFRIIDVTNKDRIDVLNNDFKRIGKNLAKMNNEKTLFISQKHHFAEFGKKDFATQGTKDLLDEGKMEFEYNPRYLINSPLENSSQNDFYSIVFCPVKGEKIDMNGNFINPNGVRFVHEKLNSNSKGFFFASDNDEIGEDVHKHFIDFTSDNTKHIVCTKAFGMGIDKKDIRSTYHYVYSGSLESLVQEAGRSGRDKKVSEANILISTSKYIKFDIYKFFKENNEHQLIQKKLTRKALRQVFEQKWNDEKKVFEKISFKKVEEVRRVVENTDFSLKKKDGTNYNILSAEHIQELKELLLETNINSDLKYIVEKYEDRDIHNFFHNMSFKGVDTEKSQLLNLFKIKEFQVANGGLIDIADQDTLINEFEKCTTDHFKFIITATKKYSEPSLKICELLKIVPTETPQYGNGTFRERITKAYNYSNDFQDFLFLLDENDVKELELIDQITKDRLLFVYSRDRDTANDTGRLIYRMHSMGFLEDYIIDYNLNKLHACTFRKYQSIDRYVEIIEAYLKRYSSEQTVLEKIEELRNSFSNSTLIQNILECLNFLAEFSYNEIASKRTRATDEIETILNKSVTDEAYTKSWYEQNIYIKEQIYFYFNAKYARIGYKINGDPFSLLDDYEDKLQNNFSVLSKYLAVYKLEGTEQNNYKHMMGSCKKILRSLTESDLNKEWLLRLLKAFSMYSVNNASYISEANAELELGFINLYNDTNFHNNNYEIIEPIFESYFKRLEKNIDKGNASFKDIKLIRAKILIKMQTFALENLILKHNKLRSELYA